MKISLIIVLTLFLVNFVYSQQEVIVENVDVGWWVIPVFAIDSSNQSITDLTETDLELLVDNHNVENIVLMKKDFSTLQQESPQEQPIKKKPAFERQKNVFLLFDTALSTKESTEKAKSIAHQMVLNAEKNTRFFILTIEPFTGLVFAGGQTNNKELIIDIISKKVIPKDNIRVPSYREVVEQVEGKNSKYDESDLGFFTLEAGKYHMRKGMNYIRSFKSLYYSLKSIKDNKFVYLFSEGVSHAMRTADTGNETLYRRYLGQLSDYLGRCGAVLFIINPFGTVTPNNSESSGEDSLRFIAKESGGKYLEGSEASILDSISNFHKAYYEIFFPGVNKSKSGILKISVNSRRKGVTIHTLRAAEKNKTFTQMDPMEREVTVLNLITGNPLYESGLHSDNLDIKSLSSKRDNLIYTIVLPDQYVRQSLDLYKVRMDTDGKNTMVEKEILSSAPYELKITFKKIKEGQNLYFVLVDSKQNCALVHGVKRQEGDSYQVALPSESEEWATKEIMAKEKKEMSSDDGKNLNLLLQGAAQYCEKLKSAAFHYICTERIAETQVPFTRTRGPNSGDLSFSEPQDEFLYQRQVVNDQESARIITETTVEKRRFNYRLLKSGENVKEERNLLKDEDKKKKNSKEYELTTEEAVKRIRFLSSKSVFGPITLLAADRQDRYDFRLVGQAEIQGRKAAIIEALPKNNTETMFLYGKVWIDKENYSILKIKANPSSIVGYERLKKFADQLNTKLYLELETDFFKFKDGICFPTSIRFEETYKGGPLVSSRRGTKGWTRTKTLTEYSDYMFFDIKTEVTY